MLLVSMNRGTSTVLAQYKTQEPDKKTETLLIDFWWFDGFLMHFFVLSYKMLFLNSIDNNIQSRMILNFSLCLLS